MRLLTHGLHCALVAVALTLLALVRPPSSAWPDAVERMRKKEKGAAGSLAGALIPARHVWPDLAAVGALAMANWQVGTAEWPERGLWAADLGVATVACTRRACFVGVLGAWRRFPRWRAQHDLWVLLGAHGAACALAHLDLGAYHRHFTPRLKRPHSLLLGAFATASPFELLWFGSSLLGVGAELQRGLGRLGYLALYLAGAAASTAFATATRHSSNGSGGVLATCAFHALAHPNARHSVFGLEMGARASLGAQVLIASCPSFVAGGATLLTMNAIPVAVGIGIFQSGALARWR